MSRPPRALVVGGSVVDLLAHAAAPLIEATSNPGQVRMVPGGVGRNIAENLARLGTPVELVTAIGSDPAGVLIRDACRRAGVGLTWAIETPEPTGTYAAVLGPDGELAIAVADLSATDALTPAQVAPALADIGPDDIVVIDANLPTPLVSAVLAAADLAGARTVAEPVSVAKAIRVAPALYPPPWLLTPNLDELAALTARPVTLATVPQVAASLLDAGTTHVWCKLGATGSVLVSAGPSGPITLAFAAPVVPVADVTGAGDALVAGFVHATLRGAAPAEAADYGHRVAALTVASPHVVRPDLSDALVRSTGGMP